MTTLSVTQCRACGSTDLFSYLDLGTQPPANSFHAADDVVESFPLQLRLCRVCYLSQLSVVVDPVALYKHYVYVTGTTHTMQEYSTKFAEWISQITPVTWPRSVLDIASNDGTLLDAFKPLGWETWGVDPAENLTPVAAAKGHHVITDFWGYSAIQQMPKGHKFEVITAQNVFAHTHDILAFLQACQVVMHEKSMLYIQTSQSEMFLRNEFDTTYHEHLSFFNSLAMHNIAMRAGMVLENVFKTNIHGTSYVFCLSLNGGVHPSSNAEGVLTFEKQQGLYDERTYVDFASKSQRIVQELADFVALSRASGKKVIGFGAAAKGMTVLNFGKIDLDYIVDENPLKQGLLSPGRNIPVVAPQQLYDEPDTVVIVPLAWNFAEEIMAKIKAQRGARDTYVTYFPQLNITMPPLV